MEEKIVDTVVEEGDFLHRFNLTCDPSFVPSAIEQIESLGFFAIGLLSFGSVLWMLNLYFAVDACHNVLFQKESRSYKVNAISILVVYPIAGLCSLTTIAIPRAYFLSEAVTQVFLTISLYRLYLLLIEVGSRKITKSPPLMLRVGPCCCWPCISFPNLEMNKSNLYWIELMVLQLPIIQGSIYCILLFMSVEAPILVTRYGIYLQPLAIASILFGIYGLTITTKSFQAVIPDAELHHKTTVSQLVLLFSKLQGFIVKSLSNTRLFPCNPPITPKIYANVTYNSLMIVEMLLLCYAANQIYCNNLGKMGHDNTLAALASDKTKDKETKSVEMNINDEVTTPQQQQQQQITVQLTAVTA